MARYIDAEILKAEFYLHYGEHVDAFARLIDKQPTADVAPKSEVAREIFEEIEDSIAVHAFTRKSEDYAEGMYDAIEWVDSKIAELKKKYQEEQT
jgi:dienelactone hydrolase